MEENGSKPKQSKPSFPRPSSHVAKEALQNRLNPQPQGRRFKPPGTAYSSKPRELDSVKESEPRPPEPTGGASRPDRPAVTFKEGNQVLASTSPEKGGKENGKEKAKMKQTDKKHLLTSAEALQKQTHVQMDTALLKGGLESVVETLGTEMEKSGFTYLRTDSANNNPYVHIVRLLMLSSYE